MAAQITGTPAPDTTAPTAPTGLKAKPANTQVSLSWLRATDNVGVARYQVWRSRSATSGFAQVGNHHWHGADQRLAGAPDDVLVQGPGGRHRGERRTLRSDRLSAHDLS